MTGEFKRFSELISKRFKEMAEIQTAWVVVKSVDWSEKTMVATGVADELDYFDVLLGLDADYKRPKVGAKAIIGIIDNQPGNSFLIYAEQLEEIEINVGKSLLHIKDNGFILKQGSESFKTVLNDMIDELNKIIVIQGTTINVPAMNLIKQRLNNILIE